MPRHPKSERFHAILAELGELHDKKQADYGRGDDPFANIRGSLDWGIPPHVGALLRMNDKVRRLQTWVANGTLANEGAEDSMRDIAVYAVIALVLLEDETTKENASENKGIADPGLAAAAGDPTEWIKSFPPAKERESFR